MQALEPREEETEQAAVPVVVASQTQRLHGWERRQRRQQGGRRTSAASDSGCSGGERGLACRHPRFREDDVVALQRGQAAHVREGREVSLGERLAAAELGEAKGGP